jgi:hypothetical protein
MPTAIPSPFARRFIVFAIAVTLGSSPLAHADGFCWPTTSDLRRMNVEQLDQVFAQGRVDGLPVGAFRGTVLLQTDARLPRLRARLENVVWKGKVFDPDGQFINQWAGFRAVPSHVAPGQSWYDGWPCLVVEYPPDSTVFANNRDELRAIAPGVFLGRFYERSPYPKLQGYFVLRR